MDLDELAAFERTQGLQVVKCGGVHWKRVRPFFYRPLMAHIEYPVALAHPPLRARLGGYQFAVPTAERTNSYLNVLLFQDAQDYSLENVERKNQVKTAAKQFELRKLDNAEKFTHEAHGIYVEFHRRTQYEYKEDRLQPDGFAAWARTLFACPKVLVVGAYRAGRLEAAAVMKWVADTLIYSTFFCNDEALRLNVTSLMLHTVRETARACPGIRQVSVGMYKFQGFTGIDKFYLLKGCSVVRKPAVFRINPLVGATLRRRKPDDYAKLRGLIDGPPEVLQRSRPAPPATAAGAKPVESARI